VLIVLIFCLVVVSGLLSVGVVVWFVVLGMEEGWDSQRCFTSVFSAKGMIFSYQFSRSYDKSVYAQFKGKFKH
jgi:hypothetical protein